ncbi:MAG: hypothetical protein EOS07_31860 [Mesorhizobium sp.]|nr:MAG: hypothetical protein EOS07_31860 [Mesorhizobium sp.]
MVELLDRRDVGKPLAHLTVYRHPSLPLARGKENPWRESAFSCCVCRGEQLSSPVTCFVAIDGIGVPLATEPSWKSGLRAGFFLPVCQLSYDSMICHGKRSAA